MTISNAAGNVGLFSELNNGGVIKDVGIINPSVSGGTGDGINGVGVLVGRINSGGAIYTSYAQGGTITTTNDGAELGGLVGRSAGTIRASYSTVSITAPNNDAAVTGGGLLGNNRGGLVVASYAAGSVSVSGSSSESGGLIGVVQNGGTTTDSYCDTTG